MMHPVMFCFGRGFLHFTCNYLPLSAKQMTKDIYPIILFSSNTKLQLKSLDFIGAASCSARCHFVPQAQNPSAVHKLHQRKQVFGCRLSCELQRASGAIKCFLKHFNGVQYEAENGTDLSWIRPVSHSSVRSAPASSLFIRRSSLSALAPR